MNGSIWMVGLGILMGLALPTFALLPGVPSGHVLTPLYDYACLAAAFYRLVEALSDSHDVSRVSAESR
jgi:hypothetical protein